MSCSVEAEMLCSRARGEGFLDAEVGGAEVDGGGLRLEGRG